MLRLLCFALFAIGCDAEEVEEEDPTPMIETCASSGDSCGLNTICVDLEPGSFEGKIGFTCECDEGFVLETGACVDVDECTESFDGCDAHASCTNTDGAYSCACDEGYEGDGFSCEPSPLSAEVIELAGKYLVAQQGLREAIIFGSNDGVIDLDDDGTLSFMDMIAARCAAYTESEGELFPEMSRGCPITGEVQVDRLLSLGSVVEGECTEDSDCDGQSPGTPRCVSPDATCRCLPIGRSGLAECQPSFP